ncbi:MAG: thioredoxin family protein [Deltaproteobacteria bacterium]|nr:MAG: thioredoxin family protein [Deltaproteobacteria bacterium]
MKRVLVALLLAASVSGAHAELPSASEADVTRALASGRPTLVDLGAGSCASCKQMAPILEELAATYRDRANVLFVDVREDAAAGKRFRIQMIPTQIFYDARGREVSRHVGFLERADLVKGLQGAGLE